MIDTISPTLIWAGAMLALTIASSSVPVRAQNTRCRFVDSSLTFSGSPREQAQCLLRPVKMYGRLGEPLSVLAKKYLLCAELNFMSALIKMRVSGFDTKTDTILIVKKSVYSKHAETRTRDLKQARACFLHVWLQRQIDQ